MVWWSGMSGKWTALVAVITCLGALMMAGPAVAQVMAPTPSRVLVDVPTAGLVPEASFETQLRTYPGGGVMARADVGLLSWLSLGGAYGGMQVIGDGRPDWYPQPAFALKIRVLQEDFVVPALAVGIDTEGSGHYNEELQRFQYKSKGIYAVLSKNYAWYGDFSVHGGLNRSLEEGDDENLTPFLGLEKSVGSAVGLALEYDLALNDNRDDGIYGRGRGYLNFGLNWSLASGIGMRFSIRDMLKNSEKPDPLFSDVIVDEGWGREFTISYMESF